MGGIDTSAFAIGAVTLAVGFLWPRRFSRFALGPLVALAGVLVKVGWDIIDWRMLGRVHRLRREHLVMVLGTLGLTVFVDLITAVAIGLIAGGMVHARRLERLEFDSVVSVPLLDAAFFEEDGTSPYADPHSARVSMVALKGTLSVASSHKLVSVIGLDIREHEVVIFDFSDTVYIDDSAAMVIGQLLELAALSETECIVTGLGHDVAATLHSLDILGGMPADRIVGTFHEARRAAREVLEADAADRNRQNPPREFPRNRGQCSRKRGHARYPTMTRSQDASDRPGGVPWQVPGNAMRIIGGRPADRLTTPLAVRDVIRRSAGQRRRARTRGRNPRLPPALVVSVAGP